MPRTNRLKVVGASAYYHIISRTVGKEFLLGTAEKEKLLDLIRLFSNLYFVKVIGFCIMDNHFHLLVKMEDGNNFSDEEILSRLSEYYNRDEWQFKDRIDFYRKKLGDISEYVKAIKNTFSRWYNKKYQRTGYFWGDRFKSVLVEEGEALMNMLIYIDLNPVRAGVVQLPEEYRWSSIGYRIGKGNDKFLSFDGLYETDAEALKEYLKMLYMVAGINFEGDTKGEKLLDKKAHFLHRIRYFTEGVVIGSSGFVKEMYDRFAGILKKKENKAHKVDFFQNIFSLRRFKLEMEKR